MAVHPLALIVYNRPEHLERVLAALGPQKPEPLYVFCDGPKDEADKSNVAEARNLVRGISWTDPVVHWQGFNDGLGRAVMRAVDSVLSVFETVIILEDDCEPGPHFMAWMNHCLDTYKNDPRILAISGYTVNIPADLRGDWDCYVMPRVETWGWATWRHKWQLYERDVKTALARARAQNIPLDRGGPDVPAMLLARAQGRNQSWSPGWMLACYLNDMYCLYPTVSHIQNIGMDGSGVHCGVSKRWETAIAQEKPTKFFASAEAALLGHGSGIIDYVKEYHAHYY